MLATDQAAPQTASTGGINIVAQEGSAVHVGPLVYLDGLPQAENPVLRAAFEEGRRLQQEGEESQSTHKHKDAIDRFTRALALAENDSQRAALHNLRGNSYHSISEYGDAEADHQRTLELSGCISDATEAAHARSAALGSLGLVYAARGHLNKAEEHYKKALDIDKRIGNRQGEAILLCNLGYLDWRRGAPRDAEERYKKALDIVRDIGDRQAEADQLLYLAFLYLDNRHPDQAEECIEQALDIHRELGDPLQEAHGLVALCQVYRQRDDHGKADQYCRKALSVYRQFGDRYAEAAALGNLGNVYFGRGDLEEAEESYQQSLAIHRQIGDRLGQAQDLANLGLVHLKRGDTANARDCLQQAQAIYQQIGAGGQGPENVRRWLELVEELEGQQPTQPPE